MCLARNRRLRNAVEDWIRDTPKAARPNLLGRLRDRKNDRNAKAAFYELALHAYFRSQGYQVGMNEAIGPGDADLLVQNGCRFLVEIATVFSEPADETAERHLTKILATVDALRDENYFASVALAQAA